MEPNCISPIASSSGGFQCCLVGGFNPSEKYSSNWIISPNRGENNEYLKPPPSCFFKGNQKWRDTVDGSEIRRLPLEGKVVLSHSLQGFIRPRWLFGIYSINSNNNVLHSWLCVGVWFYEIRDVIMRGKKKKKKESSWHCSDSGTMKLYLYAITAHEDLRFFCFPIVVLLQCIYIYIHTDSKAVANATIDL